MTVAQATQAKTPIRERLGRGNRLSSPGLRRSEQSIDSQIGLRDIRRTVARELEAHRAEHARDQVTDRQRIRKYKAVADAIATCDPVTARKALVSLAAFEFADEYTEDASRDGEIVALERLGQNVTDLHDALHELTPALIEGVARPARRTHRA